MIEIKDLLSKFSNTLLKEEMKKELIRETISKTINFQIKKENIKIKNGVVYLNIKPIYKNEILLKKDKIIFELERVLGKKTPKDIR